ncbi:TPA: PaaI family thioesterase [Streptococcus pyogenes]|nr:PaaI family thioesterase [Streptococcus pyogenes]
MSDLTQEVTLNVISIFDNYQIELAEKGHLILSTEVTETALNYYGNAHGGYLFTLCDQVGGLVARTTGVESVTLQANANYLKAGHKGDKLMVEGRLVHGGRTTQVVDVTIHNQTGALLTKTSLTMFVTGRRHNG